MAAASDEAPALVPERRLKRARDTREQADDDDYLPRPDIAILGGLEGVEQIEATLKYLRERAQRLYDQVQELTGERDRLDAQTRELGTLRDELGGIVDELRRDLATRAEENTRLTAANADLDRRLASSGAEVDQLTATVAARQTELATLRENLAVMQRTTQEIGDRSQAALRTLDAFSFLIGGSPLVKNLPFAIVQNWNSMLTSAAGAPTVRAVIQRVYDGLRVEASELAQVLALAGVIADLNDSGAVPTYTVREMRAGEDSYGDIQETLARIVDMLRNWTAPGGTLAKVVEELDTVRARLRDCAARARYEGSLPDLYARRSEGGVADTYRAVADCVSVPADLLDAYLFSAEMPSGA